MTGTALAPIIIPIVAVVTLAAWLTLVFYADAHPHWRAGQATANEPAPAGADAAPGRASPHVSAHDGEDASSEPAPGVIRRAA
jgi:hypothetical protein